MTLHLRLTSATSLLDLLTSTFRLRLISRRKRLVPRRLRYPILNLSSPRAIDLFLLQRLATLSASHRLLLRSSLQRATRLSGLNLRLWLIWLLLSCLRLNCRLPLSGLNLRLNWLPLPGT